MSAGDIIKSLGKKTIKAGKKGMFLIWRAIPIHIRLIIIAVVIAVIILIVLFCNFLDIIDTDTVIKGPSFGLPFKRNYSSSLEGESGFIEGGPFLQKAQEIHKYMEENSYTYSLDGLPSTFEESKTNKVVCCATYVYFVAMEAGYNLQGGPYHNADAITKVLIEQAGFTEVGIDDMKAGDVVNFVGEHVQIYAGNDQWYNAGSIEAIQTPAPSGKGIDPHGYSGQVRIARPPQ